MVVIERQISPDEVRSIPFFKPFHKGKQNS